MKRYYKYFALFVSALTVLVSCEEDEFTDNASKQERLSAPTAFQANFSATNPTDGEITLSWGGSEGAESYTVALYNGNVDINSVTPIEGEKNCVGVYTTTEPTLSLTSLSMSVTTYYAYVQATSTDKNFTNSSWTTVYFSPKYNAPIIPQASFVSIVSGQTVTIQWSLESSVTPTELIASVDGVVMQTRSLTEDDVENAELVFEGLSPYTRYDFELVGEDSYGKTAAFTYPIYELTAVMESETNQNMIITWNADAYPEFAATTITYEPYNQDQEGAYTIDPTAAVAGTATVSDLKYGDMKYTFTIYINGVAAGNAAGVTGVVKQSEAIAVANTENLAAVIAAAKSGSVLELAGGTYANTVGEIVVDKNITLQAAAGATPVLNGVYFTVTDAALVLNGITCKGTTGVKTFISVSGATSGLKLMNSTFNNLSLTERFIAFTTAAKELVVDNCIISNIAAPSEVMDFIDAIDYVQISNSTIAEIAAGTTYFIDFNKAVGDVVFDANTFVNNTHRGIRFRATRTSFTLTNSIYADNTGVENRILYSNSADAPSVNTNNYAYGFFSSRVPSGFTVPASDVFVSWTPVNGIYAIDKTVIVTNAGDPDGL